MFDGPGRPKSIGANMGVSTTFAPSSDARNSSTSDFGLYENECLDYYLYNGIYIIAVG